jgi:hypothetical protein
MKNISKKLKSVIRIYIKQEGGRKFDKETAIGFLSKVR